MDFEWDPNKAKLNLAKHGLSFEEAITAFDDPLFLRENDANHSADEPREWLIGRTGVHLAVVVFTVRMPGNVHRLISARRANRSERRRYEKTNRVRLH